MYGYRSVLASRLSSWENNGASSIITTLFCAGDGYNRIMISPFPRLDWR
ncbi:hypothetical protein C2W64_00126 [Brevibacillus laterosporus]|nr:hypothetical protein C2W64_00126 [Brevibacillus laterosporus]